MNRVIKFLIFSDVALALGFGFINPIFAIFLTRRIEGGSIEVAGYAAAVYWVVISLTVIPFGKFLDKNYGEKDDFWFIIIGNIFAALSVLGYIFSYLPWHIYALQVIYSLGMAMNISAYAAIFTRHIDKGKESSNWSVRASFVGIGAGITGALGGIIADHFGFNFLFSIIIVFVLISALLPFFIYKRICPKDEKSLRIPFGKNF